MTSQKHTSIFNMGKSYIFVDVKVLMSVMRAGETRNSLNTCYWSIGVRAVPHIPKASAAEAAAAIAKNINTPESLILGYY